MKSLAFLLTTLTLLSGAVSASGQKSVIISYPPETPDSIVDQAKKAVVDAGGVITHEYQLIKYVRVVCRRATFSWDSEHADMER